MRRPWPLQSGRGESGVHPIFAGPGTIAGVVDSEFFAAKLAKPKSERETIELQMQITRGERIPIEDVAASEKMIFGFIRGTLLANHNKVLTQDVINEIFAEWRARADELKAMADKLDSGNGQFPGSGFSFRKAS